MAGSAAQQHTKEETLSSGQAWNFAEQKLLIIASPLQEEDEGM